MSISLTEVTIKILYHHRTQGKGVEGVHICEMISAWEKQGHCIDIISPIGNSIGEESQQTPGGYLHHFYRQIAKSLPEIVFELLEILYNLTASLQFKKKFKKKNYELIYERHALLNWVGGRHSRKQSVPLILEVNYTSRTPLYRKRSFIMKPLAYRVDQYLFREAEGLVAVSTYLKDHLVRDFGVPEEKIIVLPNAADPEKFSPAVLGEGIRSKLGLQGKKVIGFVGGFYPWHGLHLFFEGLGQVFNRVKEAMVLLIGEGPEKSIFMKWAEREGMGDRILFLGSLPHKELPCYIAVFDLAVLPDSNEYGSPMKVYEYMAMAKPVVAPRLGPLLEAMTHGEEGLLFEPKNVNDLSKALIALLEDNEMRARMGRAAREKILKKHNWKRNAESVIELYQRIVERKREKISAGTGKDYL